MNIFGDVSKEHKQNVRGVKKKKNEGNSLIQCQLKRADAKSRVDVDTPSKIKSGEVQGRFESPFVENIKSRDKIFPLIPLEIQSELFITRSNSLLTLANIYKKRKAESKHKDRAFAMPSELYSSITL